MLQGTLEAASFSFEPADDQALLEISRQAEALAEYFEAASVAPGRVTLGGYNQVRIPAGPRESMNRLADALSDKLGIVGACQTGDSQGSEN